MNERFFTHLGVNYAPAYICGLSDEELAEKIREASEWDIDLLRDLCWRAGLIEEWDESGDDYVEVAYKAAEIFRVEI